MTPLFVNEPELCQYRGDISRDHCYQHAMQAGDHAGAAGAVTFVNAAAEGAPFCGEKQRFLHLTFILHPQPSWRMENQRMPATLLQQIRH